MIPVILEGTGDISIPREILRSISNAEFIEMDERRLLGFGGIFSLNHYDLASDMGKKGREHQAKQCAGSSDRMSGL